MLQESPERNFDVLVIGAGLSGICAGYHLQTQSPGKSYAILEGRSEIGGTWDLFRYPGIRSDSDMFTMGFSFRSWRDAKAIADGPSILKYLHDTAQENGIDRKIRFQHRVQSASWSSDDSLWTVETLVGPEKKPIRYTCRFLYLCSGYYDYASGHTPRFEGAQDFQGRIIHPQHWPQDLDYTGKRIVVIGSGATAVTLVPSMAGKAAHVTMLQRSPTYIVSLPAEDRVAQFIRRLLPENAAHRTIRWKNVLLGLYFFQLCRRAPGYAKRMFLRRITQELPPGFDIETHFTPRYNPWDQRVCLVPDSDLFLAIKSGKVSVVTDQITRFTSQGILLQSGTELPADIIVTATGLKMLACGGIRLSVDGEPAEPGGLVTYKGLMLSNVPNCAMCVGYTNASWTLRADLTSMYVCRLINFMDRHGYKKCVPSDGECLTQEQPLLGLTSGYVLRGVDQFPKQGSKAPWIFRQNYLYDMLALRFRRIDDGTLKFSKGASPSDSLPEDERTVVAAQQATSPA
jgi:cation diffusion facilitator CzcD-associated flavoprotein CzcO